MARLATPVAKPAVMATAEAMTDNPTREREVLIDTAAALDSALFMFMFD